MVGDFHHFHEAAVGAGAGHLHAVGGELLAVDVVELIAVTMPLGDFQGPVTGGRFGVGRQPRRLRP